MFFTLNITLILERVISNLSLKPYIIYKSLTSRDSELVSVSHATPDNLFCQIFSCLCNSPLSQEISGIFLDYNRVADSITKPCYLWYDPDNISFNMYMFYSVFLLHQVSTSSGKNKIPNNLKQLSLMTKLHKSTIDYLSLLVCL